MTRTTWSKMGKSGFIAIIAALVVFCSGIAVAAFSIIGKAGQKTVAYYTVDINPSVCVGVNRRGHVTEIKGQNEDSDALLPKLNCKGKSIAAAIKQFIKAAEEAGYLTDKKYVLIGCFGDAGTKTEETISNLQKQLESDFGDMISLLIISGSLEDKQLADDLQVSPGLLKLSSLTGDLKIDGDDKIEDILNEVNGGNVFDAPVISVTNDGSYIKLAWEGLDFSATDYEGDVTYKIAVGSAEEEITGMTAMIIDTLIFPAGGEQPLAYTIISEEYGIQPGETKYFAVYAEYGSEITVISNIVQYTLPAEAGDPTVSPEPTTEPTQEPEPAATPGQDEMVTGKVKDKCVVLKWQKSEADNFKGYKIVASLTNSNPKYPEDGCLMYITDSNKTSVSLFEGFSGLKGGKTYYFSVTYLFKDGEKITGNAVKLTVPSSWANDKDDYKCPTIYGKFNGKNANLNWTKINSDKFKGYWVVYSFTNSTPQYGAKGCYATWVNPAYTNYSSDFKSLNGYRPGAKCYFNVFANYEGGIIKAGNVISLTMPAETEEILYISTKISGALSDDGKKINLSWEAISHPKFAGYKLVYSFKDTTPVYGEKDVIAEYIGEASVTSRSVNVKSLKYVCGYEPGKDLYISITALYYQYGSYAYKLEPGNVITVKIPDDPAEPYALSAISGEIGADGKITLNWTPVIHSKFKAYKILCSFTDSTPEYYESGVKVLAYVKDASVTSGTYSVDDLKKLFGYAGYKPGADCYFWTC